MVKILKGFPNRILHNVSKTRKGYHCESEVPLYKWWLITSTGPDKNVEIFYKNMLTNFASSSSPTPITGEGERR